MAATATKDAEAKAPAEKEKPKARKAPRKYPPDVGVEVWYYLPTTPPEWRPAKVVDRDPLDPGDGPSLAPPWTHEKAVHLAVSVERGRHHAARDVVLRQEIKPGNEPGQYRYTKPKDADALYDRQVEQMRMRDEVVREIIQGRQSDSVTAAAQAAADKYDSLDDDGEEE